jgi:hypothetical protein
MEIVIVIPFISTVHHQTSGRAKIHHSSIMKSKERSFHSLNQSCIAHSSSWYAVSIPNSKKYRIRKLQTEPRSSSRYEERDNRLRLSIRDSKKIGNRG